MHETTTEGLIELGMTPTEAKVYLEICMTGDTKIGPIIKKTGLHRGTVYNTIDNLTKKGFVSFLDEGKDRIYKLTGKKIFNTIIQENKTKISRQEKEIENFFSQIETLQKKATKQNVRVFYGKSSFKTLFLDMLEECRKNKEEYLVQGRAGVIQETVGEGFYKECQDLKKKGKIGSKAIIDTGADEKKYSLNFYGKSTFSDLERDSPSSIWIYRNKVLFVLFGTNPLVSIIIENKSIASAFRKNFQKLWGLSNHLEDRQRYSLSLNKLIASCSQLDVLCKNDTPPFFIYPHNEQEFMKYRVAREKGRTTLTQKHAPEILRNYKRLWKKGAKMRYIVTKNSLDKFFKMIEKNFGKKEVLDRVIDIEKNILKYNVEVNFIDEFNPHTIYLSEKAFLLVLPLGEKISGFKTEDNQVIQTYVRLYSEYLQRSKPILLFLEEIKNKIIK